LRESGKEKMLDEAYQRCKKTEKQAPESIKNEAIDLYTQFTDEQISQKISEIVRPANLIPELQVIFQTIEGLHNACPTATGDWYFTGKYPTAGGNRVVNRAFMNFMEDLDVRAY
jgi:amidophosphoribosyltransferase